MFLAKRLTAVVSLLLALQSGLVAALEEPLAACLEIDNAISSASDVYYPGSSIIVQYLTTSYPDHSNCLCRGTSLPQRHFTLGFLKHGVVNMFGRAWNKGGCI